MGYLTNDYTVNLHSCERQVCYASYDQIIAQIFIDEWNLHNWRRHKFADCGWTSFLEARIELCRDELRRREGLHSLDQVVASDIPF